MRLTPNVFPASSGDLLELLDAVQDQLLIGCVSEGMERLFIGLREQRLGRTAEEWKPLADVCLRHPLRALIHQDALTERCFRKPRGYPGDAPLLDIIYGVEYFDADTRPPTALGAAIRAYLLDEPAARAVRYRRELLAALLDRVGGEVQRPRVLSVAAGHLREVELSEVVRGGRVGEYLALDQDAASLQEVQRRYGQFGLTTWHASLRPLLTSDHEFGPFDLIYVAGLYDYLAAPTARRLTRNLFALLTPGGRLLVANFLPGILDVGYMESFMDWKLIYRTRKEMLEISLDIPQADLADLRIFAEENQNIIFLLCVKR